MFQYLILGKRGTLTFPQCHTCDIAEKMMTDKLYMGPQPFNFAVFSKRGGDGLVSDAVYFRYPWGWGSLFNSSLQGCGRLDRNSYGWHLTFNRMELFT